MSRVRQVSPKSRFGLIDRCGNQRSESGKWEIVWFFLVSLCPTTGTRRFAIVRLSLAFAARAISLCFFFFFFPNRDIVVSIQIINNPNNKSTRSCRRVCTISLIVAVSHVAEHRLRKIIIDRTFERIIKRKESRGGINLIRDCPVNRRGRLNN